MFTNLLANDNTIGFKKAKKKSEVLTTICVQIYWPMIKHGIYQKHTVMSSCARQLTTSTVNFFYLEFQIQYGCCLKDLHKRNPKISVLREMGL